MELLNPDDPEIAAIIAKHRPALTMKVFYIPDGQTEMVVELRWAPEIEAIHPDRRPLAKLYEAVSAAVSGLAIMGADIRLKAVDRGLLSNPPPIDEMPILASTAIVPGKVGN